MPSRRRSMQPQPAVQSDYDTDTPVPAPVSLSTPQWTLDTLNEEVLRMYLPDLEYIEKVAPFTVVYLFSPESQQWEKSGCEGTLFLCKMPGSRYSAVVLNRKSLDNFVMDLKSADDVEITNEYVILQSTNDNGVPQIYGLWIYNDDGKTPTTKDLMGQAIQRAAMEAEYALQMEDAGLYDEEEHQEEDQETLGSHQGPGYNTHSSYQHPPYQPQPQDMQSHPQVRGQHTPSGQPLDINKLFSKPQIQQETQISSIPGNAHAASGQQLDLLKLFGNPHTSTQGRQQRPVATLFPA